LAIYDLLLTIVFLRAFPFGSAQSLPLSLSNGAGCGESKTALIGVTAVANVRVCAQLARKYAKF
jgi:hypothetical protein